MISAIYDSLVGALTLVSNGAALTQLEFENLRYPTPVQPLGNDRLIDAARRRSMHRVLGMLF